MRVFSQSFLPWRRLACSGLQVGAYGVFIAMLMVVVLKTGEAVLRHAEAPVSDLLNATDVADIDATALILGTVGRSSILESEAWVESLKANKWQDGARGRAGSPFASSTSLLGRGAQDFLDGKTQRSLNDAAQRSNSRTQSATHRTMCVRLCDGYFWPISFSTTEDNFERDEAVCERSCSQPAKLYVYANPGQEPDQMVSVKGQAYSRLSTAFQFRKTIDQSCKCNPHPWEQEAMDRHRSYAADATKQKAQLQAVLDAKAVKSGKPKKESKTQSGTRASLAYGATVDVARADPPVVAGPLVQLPTAVQVVNAGARVAAITGSKTSLKVARAKRQDGPEPTPKEGRLALGPPMRLSAPSSSAQLLPQPPARRVEWLTAVFIAN
jgi:Protein of unknown function (DUF2865)